MPTLNEKITELENKIKKLENAITQITEEQFKTSLPSLISVTKGHSLSTKLACDIETGYGNTFGGKIIWNDIELKIPQGSEEIINLIPTKGYHCHSHSRFSGGALDINTLELVEYERDDNNIIKPGLPQDSQSYWGNKPIIAVADKYQSPQMEAHSLGGQIAQNVANQVPKIGKVAWVFNPNQEKWGASAYEIDIKNCFFVEYDKDGNIVKDENEVEKKAPIWNEDPTKTSIVWDKNGKCWRLYAVYAEEPENQIEE